MIISDFLTSTDALNISRLQTTNVFYVAHNFRCSTFTSSSSACGDRFKVIFQYAGVLLTCKLFIDFFINLMRIMIKSRFSLHRVDTMCNLYMCFTTE